MDLRQAHDSVRELVMAALGRDPGALHTLSSDSHYVYAGSDVVVKIIDARDHTRLEREIILSPQLPTGLTAPLLDSGRHRMGDRDIRYACYTRVPGAAPGMGLAGVNERTARTLAEQAVRLLQQLHEWVPDGPAEQTLRERLDHGGFASRSTLLSQIEDIAALDPNRIVPRRMLDSLTAIAESASSPARADVPVHADCHWGNWLVGDGGVTALLDFEWARFGEPVDDWFFLARFSGPHLNTVLSVIANLTATPVDSLRGQCELREASYLASDLGLALQHPGDPARAAAGTLRDLQELTADRIWWMPDR